ncbi:MAG TPA: ABC transporter permease [Actinomycetota bacterium]|jgi:ABC-2 type transport system permease protein
MSRVASALRSRLGPGAGSNLRDELRSELIGLGGVVERNVYLVKRYAWWELAFLLWTCANSLTVVLIAKGIEAAGGHLDVNRQTTILLIGAVVWAYLGIIFEILTETVAWERWEGTIEYTFMAPLARPIHLLGMGLFAIAYGVVRAGLLFGLLAWVFHLAMPHANVVAALGVLALSSVSFIGIGMMTAVLPLISPEKGSQLGFIAQGILLAISGVYYSVDILPGPLRAMATFSPATYALEGMRSAILRGTGLGEMGGVLWPLAVSGLVCIPVGLLVFRAGEQYAKRHGKLKRSG